MTPTRKMMGTNDVDIEQLATEYWQEGNYTAQVQLLVDALQEAGLPAVMQEGPMHFTVYVGLCGGEVDPHECHKWVVYSYKESRMRGPTYHLYRVSGGNKTPVGPMNQVSTIISVCGGDACKEANNQ